jgi:hypothetical protein
MQKSPLLETVTIIAITAMFAVTTIVEPTFPRALAKSVTYNTSVLGIRSDGALKSFNSSSYTLNGTDQQILDQFPKVLGKFYQMSQGAPGAQAVFIGKTANETRILIQPVPEAVYTGDLMATLKGMGPTDAAVKCWITLEKGPTLHLKDCSVVVVGS